VEREDALDHLEATRLDVLVIGGGVTGAGVALDAVTRGYTCALVERDDLASGTSSKSSKLVHGGVRYLAQHDFGLVREAAQERDLLRRVAPHLAQPLGFVVPLKDRVTEAQMHAGLLLYGILATWRNVERYQTVDPGELLAAAPLTGGFDRGALRYYDARTDDARLTLQIAQTARQHGGLVVNHAEVTGLLRAGDRVRGATVVDRLAGRELDVEARWVVSATGVWAGELHRLATDDPTRIAPSKGIHLTFDRTQLPVDEAIVIPSHAGDGRLAFVVPWDDQVYVGTTDEHHPGSLDEPSVGPAEAAYLLHALNGSFGTSLTPADAVGAWAGLRPLLRPRDDGQPAHRSADLSRRHAIVEHPSGFLTITGGKLTTYRRMAQDLVDRIASADANHAPCVTAHLPLGVHGDGAAGLRRVEALCEAFEVDRSLAPSLFLRHGDAAARVLAFATEHGEADRLLPHLPYLRGEVRWAVRQELARTVDDVLQRRLRVSLRDRFAGGPAVAHTAGVLAEELGLDRQTAGAQIEAYFGRVATERGIVPLQHTLPVAVTP